jgi:hypothetical protein
MGKLIGYDVICRDRDTSKYDLKTFWVTQPGARVAAEIYANNRHSPRCSVSIVPIRG